MAQELEAKIRVPSHDPIRAKLQAANAAPEGITEETNIFFDTAGKSLKSTGQGLRLRYNKRPDGTTHVVTYKGPKQPGKYKQREEIEIAVDDPESAAALFSKLGYQERLRFHKRRESWTWKHCKIELDTLDNIGTFVEVEAHTEEEITEALQLLNLENEPHHSESYASMVAR